MKTIQILCINDFHAELRETESTPGCSKFTAFVQNYLVENPKTVVVFGGDNYKGDPLSEYSDGRPVTALMKRLGAEVSVVGNHEFDFPMDTLLRWETEGNYQFLAANVQNNKTQEIPFFARPYKIVEKSGVKIAFIGLSTMEDLNTSTHPKDIRDLQITDGVTAARKYVDTLNNKSSAHDRPDAIIAVTHFGLQYTTGGDVIGEEMRKLCESGVAIDGAFAAHWHQFMATSINGIPVAQGGSRGQGFAVLTLTFTDDNKLVSAEPSFVRIDGEIDQMIPDEEMEQVYQESYQEAMKELGEIIGYAPVDLVHRDTVTNEPFYEGSVLSQIVLQAMMNYTGCKLALFYSGWLGDGLRQGAISKYDLCRVIRFNGGIVKLKITGEDLIKNIAIGIRNLHSERLSPLAVAGIRLRIAPGKPQGQRLVYAELENGRAIVPDAVYEIAIDSSMAENAMGFDFSRAIERIYPEASIRACMEHEIRKLKIIDIPKPTNVAII